MRKYRRAAASTARQDHQARFADVHQAEIQPQVLCNVGIDPEEWSGFAFGLGLDRCAMIKFDIPNIRTLFENDLRVLQQF